MKTESYSLEDLAAKIDGRVAGDPGFVVQGISTLDDAGPSQLSFLTNTKYRKAAASTRAGALLVAPDSGLTRPNLLECAEPYLALARLLELFYPQPERTASISDDARIGKNVHLGVEVSVGPFAVVEDGVSLGDRVSVGAGCVLGSGSAVGDDTELKPRVVLYPRTRIGARCLIHSGVVLGSDGFGFATVDGVHHKVPQLGSVVVEDEVEIGANSTADRGVLGQTVIGESSKLDNLVMVAHGVHLGAGALLAAQSGIAGSTRVGPGAMLAGQSGVSGHLVIGDGTIVAAKSAVLGDLPRGSFVAGIPAVDHRRWKRSQALMTRLPEMRKELRRLCARLESLERNLAEREGSG